LAFFDINLERSLFDQWSLFGANMLLAVFLTSSIKRRLV